ncbi:G-type lectin S-receptor-like serine/threonine-protein kinase SD3-1 [Tripterygium wilfordii]|uniref:G-type lectin S-receptor-like serine/threonine-protein kinase SD3-1 n=1 Tax=Tripterygium wilfordii TaxID=458696 RepID=UPI0018F84ABF|nr:G-type lectin S-receptor-like serine/threonine-protein kinase SD3-1 [Tripterygium wilfordii]
MFVVRLNLLISRIPNWQFQGVCENVPMVSTPLGFEISGFDGGRTYVSQNGVFAFGFFEGFKKLDDDDVDGFVVGIRYNLGDKAANVPVWTVGGGLRVSLNSTVKLSMDGRLILVENPSGLIVWSTDTSKSGVKKANLLNSGNLVLMDSRDKVLWESFSSPTNTLLPGQSLHFPQTLRAPSTKSISSYYSFVIHHSGELALVWESNVTYWRTHFSSSSIIKQARFDSDGVLRLVEAANSTVWSASSEDFEDPSVFLRHLRIDLDGNLRIYSWENELHRWRVTWQAVENQCHVFGSCGLYSLCGFNSTGPVCDCLYQDSVRRRDGLPTVDSGGFGCRKMVDLGNCKMNTSMMKLEHTVLYGLYPPQDVDVMLSEQACKDQCSNDSSCIAVTSQNDGSGLCTIKRTDFISGYRNPSVRATSFLKVCSVPLAVSDLGVDPHGNFEQSSIDPRPFKNQAGHSTNVQGAIAFIVLVTVFGFLTMEMFVFWFIYRRQQIDAHTRSLFRKDAQMNPHYSALTRLSYEEIKVLTGNFTNQLGPTVYKGVLPNNTPVAAKVLNGVIVTEKDFRVAVSTLGIMHHRNLVPLKGFCFEQKHKLLLYEYVPNGSLDEWMLNRKPDQIEKNWQHRLNIALGVTRALAYLHLECPRCIPHGNLKLQNVLLDEKLLPKLTDFGIQSLLPKDRASSSESPSERDIYMLGEILLQIIICKRDVLRDNLHHLVDNITEKLEPRGSKESEAVERVVRIALWCMQNEPFRRPSIGEVVQVLEGTFLVERPPPAVAYSPEQSDEGVAAEIQVYSQEGSRL